MDNDALFYFTQLRALADSVIDAGLQRAKGQPKKSSTSASVCVKLTTQSSSHSRSNSQEKNNQAFGGEVMFDTDGNGIASIYYDKQSNAWCAERESWC
jgi:hypothetical protein